MQIRTFSGLAHEGGKKAWNRLDSMLMRVLRPSLKRNHARRVPEARGESLPLISDFPSKAVSTRISTTLSPPSGTDVSPGSVFAFSASLVP